MQCSHNMVFFSTKITNSQIQDTLMLLLTMLVYMFLLFKREICVCRTHNLHTKKRQAAILSTETQTQIFRCLRLHFKSI